MQTPIHASDPADHRPGTGAPHWWRATLALILGVTLARLLYLYLLCPYNLVEDEATYWEWSRRLDWSYHTKGPGMALAIRAATALLGHSEAAIRTVSVVSSAIGALGIAALGAEASCRIGTDPRRRWDVGFVSAALFLLIPVFQVVGLLATIDGPFTACWAVASWAAFVALERRRAWGWALAGLALGVGFLFKYTILLLLPGLLFYAIWRRYRLRDRSLLAGLLVGLVLMLAGFAPVLIWNQANGWPTLAHLLGHLGMEGGDMPVAPPSGGAGWTYSPLWTIDFLLTQLGIVGPALVLGVGAAVRAVRNRKTDAAVWPAQLYLIACGTPVLLFYLLVSFKTEPEGNWAMGGYVTMAALAGWAVVEARPRYRRKMEAWRALPEPRPKAGFFRRRPEVMEQVLWHWSIATGIVVALGMARVDLIARAIPVLQGRVSSLSAAAVLANDAQTRAGELAQQTGKEPFYIAQHYGRASILAYYIPSHPSVKCTSSRMGGRVTSYDYWADTDLDDPSLRGRPALLVGATPEQWAPLFERVVPIGRLKGEHKRMRDAFLGYGYKGWPAR